MAVASATGEHFGCKIKRGQSLAGELHQAQKSISGNVISRQMALGGARRALVGQTEQGTPL